jgi:hypothetical protein
VYATPRGRRPGAAVTDDSRAMFLIQILLPISLPDPSVSVTTALADTRRELTEKFNGSTAYLRAPAKGLWTAPDGEVEQDEVVMVEVVIESLDRAWWRTYAGLLATRFRQQVIHVRVLPIELLNP